MGPNTDAPKLDSDTLPVSINIDTLLQSTPIHVISSITYPVPAEVEVTEQSNPNTDIPKNIDIPTITPNANDDVVVAEEEDALASMGYSKY